MNIRMSTWMSAWSAGYKYTHSDQILIICPEFTTSALGVPKIFYQAMYFLIKSCHSNENNTFIRFSVFISCHECNGLSVYPKWDAIFTYVCVFNGDGHQFS